MSEAWAWSDAWFFGAVASAQRQRQGRPADLWEVVAAGDAINHAIFLSGEVEQAVARLYATGLISTGPDRRFALTSEGNNVYEAVREDYWLDAIRSLHQRLDRVPLPDTVTPWALQPGELHEAASRWSSEADAWFKAEYGYDPPPIAVVESTLQKWAAENDRARSLVGRLRGMARSVWRR